MGHGSDRMDKPISYLTAAQLRATLQLMTKTKYGKTEATSKVATTTVSRATARKPESGPRNPRDWSQNDLPLGGARTRNTQVSEEIHRTIVRGRTSHHRSSDDVSCDDDSDSSSGGAAPQAATITTLGDTTLTFRPYVSSSTLEDFDEGGPLPTRRR
ncbi:unnamed protein product [Phytophthora fragariaefolia]|uniref:Unnamed protein product n=1 Tax=Phytophthora fragariaefolia TaxID=1490495 RepID=A0A9W6YA03_9STRA|nr:unnamed protein product [Phytophthora fragariaefolia]